jgi:predicted Fe-S protein YdhL (DUF1289 family)
VTEPMQPQSLPDFDPFADAGFVPSPCINVCRMNQHNGLCEGCFRTIDEIIQWSSAGDSFKRAVWVEILHRQSESKQGEVK